ncbi:MAG: hypothetical protein WAZ27_01225 [Minisyncoccia bacterium]
MSLTSGNIVRGVGRITLFIVAWAMSTLSLSIMLLMFFGVVSLSLGGFGILPEPPTNLNEMEGAVFYVYAATFTVAALMGGYFSAALVAYTYHKDSERFDKNLRYPTIVMMWMMYTTLYAFMLSFLSTAMLGFYLDIPATSESNFRLVLQEARYFLLAALIASGIFAARELEEK